MSERAWFAVECGMHKHEKMAGLPNDTARLGWYVVLAEAKLQRKQGRFASEAHFRLVVGRYARFLKDYIAAGLLNPASDGSLDVHDWMRHQWAAKKAGQREDNAGTFEGQKKDLHARGRAVTVTVPVSVSSDVENGTLRAQAEFPVLRWLAAHKSGPRPTGKLYTDLLDLVGRDGAPAVVAAMEQLGPGMDTAQYVYGARNALHPIPSGRRQTEEERRKAEIADVVARAKRGEIHAVQG